MPYPLIILENHFITSARLFVAKNAKTLKSLGYQKFLFEMNQEVSPEQFKGQLELILSNPGFKSSNLYASTDALKKMLKALEDNGIEYEFIDPESQREAQQQIIDMQQEALAGNGDGKAIKHRDETTMKRDKIMAPIIIDQAKKYNGGVLYLGGYMHRHLVSILESNHEHHFKYAIFSSSNEFLKLKNQIHREEYSTGIKLSRYEFRSKFYCGNFLYFDMDKNPSFEFIEASCGLTTQNACKKPMVLERIEQQLGQDVNSYLDEHHVVNAEFSLSSSEEKHTTSLIQSNFPRLTFFMKDIGDKRVLTIPGINLPEQQQYITNKSNK